MAEHDTLAALAAQVDDLRAKVAKMELEGPGALLVLAVQVKKHGEALNRALGKNKTLIPQAPYWPASSGEEYDRELGILRDWVDGFLRPQYPGCPVPECWPAHHEAVWELATLHAEWTRVYADEENRPLESALWFHERWMPGVRSRLFGERGSVQCHQGVCRLDQAPSLSAGA